MKEYTQEEIDEGFISHYKICIMSHFHILINDIYNIEKKGNLAEAIHLYNVFHFVIGSSQIELPSQSHYKELCTEIKESLIETAKKTFGKTKFSTCAISKDLLEKI